MIYVWPHARENMSLGRINDKFEMVGPRFGAATAVAASHQGSNITTISVRGLELALQEFY